MRIELERARLLFEACRRGGLDLNDMVKRYRHVVCHRNSYLYAVCRELKPEHVVETGVRRGESTAFILQALEDNRTGHLYSIDLPNVIMDRDTSSVLPEGGRTGYLVPDQLATSRWTLVLGDSRKELPALLDRIEWTDIFHHDSLHTYEHMLFEYREAWKRMKKGGLLLSDDANGNRAFTDFCSEVGAAGRILFEIGIASKDKT